MRPRVEYFMFDANRSALKRPAPLNVRTYGVLAGVNFRHFLNLTCHLAPLKRRCAAVIMRGAFVTLR